MDGVRGLKSPGQKLPLQFGAKPLPRLLPVRTGLSLGPLRPHSPLPLEAFGIGMMSLL